MASVDGEPQFVLHPVTAEELESFGDRMPVVVVPWRPGVDAGSQGRAGAASAASGAVPNVAMRLEGKFDGKLTVIVNCPSTGTGKSGSGGGASGGANTLWLNQSAAINGQFALDQLDGPASAFVGTTSNPSNGCGALLVLVVIVLLMMLAAGGSLASFSSHPGASSSIFAAAPANTQPIYAQGAAAQFYPVRTSSNAYAAVPANAFVQGAAATAAQPAGFSQGAYCSPCAAQPVVAVSYAPAPPVQAAPALANRCTRSPTCPGACPVAPFCANHVAVKGVCNPATGAHLYYFPGQAGYVETQVGLYVGDGYFCNFSDAVAAGFALAP